MQLISEQPTVPQRIKMPAKSIPPAIQHSLLEFLIFCPHGVCCGFEVMHSHESPKHPFEIFSNSFETPLDIIIYNNYCKLLRYTKAWEFNVVYIGHFRS